MYRLNGQWELSRLVGRGDTPEIRDLLEVTERYGRPWSVRPSMQFSGFRRGKVVVYDGCIEFFAHYEADGQRITIVPPFGPKVLIACPQDVVELNAIIGSALVTMDAYSIVDGQLHLRYSDGELVLRRSAE